MSRIITAGLWLMMLGACRLAAFEGPEGAAWSIVDTGHTGAVLGMEYDDKRGLLFSAGDDGTVRIWDAARNALVRTLEVTQLDTEQIAVNPALPQVVVVVTDHSGTFALSVWDWEAQREMYRISLTEDPLFLRFSALGTYLLYGGSAWQGLKILRASDGSPVDFHPEGFGIVGFAEMSRSERTVMTYLVSGRIAYWDLATGAQTLDLPSVPFLSDIRISSDRLSLAGSTGRELVVVDTSTGAARARAGLPGIVSLDISPAGDEITCLAGEQGAPSAWSVAGAALAPRASQPRLSVAASLVRYGSGSLYFCGAEGGLRSLSVSGEEALFGGNVLAGLTGFDAGRGAVALASSELVRVFRSDLLTGAASPSFLRSFVTLNPFHAPARLEFLADGRLLAWRSDVVAPGLALMDEADSPAAPASGGQGSGFRLLPVAFPAPLTDLRVVGELLLGVETGGVVRLATLATATTRFDLRVPGAVAALSTSPSELLVGRNSAASEGSLLRVNTRTGETVAIGDRNLFTYALALDSGATGPPLYSVGIDAAGATTLLLHQGAGFERDSLVDMVREEDLDVSMTLDPDTHRLYASLGTDRVVAWDGKRVQTLPLDNYAPRILAARGGMLFSLTKAGTVSVADGATGARLAEVFLFADGEWCILFRDGGYAASTGGDVHVRVYVNDMPVKATEDFRLRLDTR